MRFRELAAFILIILLAVSSKFSNTFKPFVKNLNADLWETSFDSLNADTVVSSPEEWQAAIREGIREVKDCIKVRIVNYNENDYNFDAALKKVLNENADLGFVSGCNVQYVEAMYGEAAVVEMRIEYYYPNEQVADMMKKTESAATEIVKRIIEPEMDEYDKVLAVHDCIIKNSVYDKLNADKSTVPPEEHEAYGVLIKGIGVCDSYSKAMKLLLDKAGIKCVIVEGTKIGSTKNAFEDADHAWNIVRIDGEYYHVDATWNDINESKSGIDVVYHFFNLNDMEMQKTHMWDRSRYPACTDIKNNYYVRNGLIVNNRDEILSVLEKAISSKEETLLLKIEDYNSFKYDLEELIKEASHNCRIKGKLVAKWITNDSLGVVDLIFIY